MISVSSRVLSLILTLSLVVTACGPAESDTGMEDAWIIEQDGIELEGDLLLTETEDYFFGRVTDIAVRSDGRMYVIDSEEYHIKVLSSDGELVDTIGRKGEGPGEFERPSEIVLARGDSIYVLDGYWGRVSVFSPDHEFSYSFSARGERTSPRNIMVPVSGDHFLFAQTPFARETVEGAVQAIRLAHASGELGDTLLTAQPGQMGHISGDNWMTFFPVPFGRQSYYAFGPEGYIHYAWSDSLKVTAYDQQGEVVYTVEVPFEGVPITQEELDVWRNERLPEGGWSVIRDEIADTKPAFEHFLVDDTGRYWFKRQTDDPEHTDWWIVNAEAQHVSVVPLPSEATILEVHDGYAYAGAQGQYGEPALARYHIVE